MNPRTVLRIWLALLCLALPSAVAQNPAPVGAAADAVQRVKHFYFALDYLGGVEEADRLLKQFPRSRELAAWRVANLARTERPREAAAAAAALLAANRNDPWGWFAQTFVLEYASEGAAAADVLKSSLEGYRREPMNPSVAWMRAVALTGNDAAAHALALIDSVALRGPLSQEMQTLRATALYNVATASSKTDEPRLDSAFALYARARMSDPSDASAYAFAASRLLNRGRAPEGYTLAKRAAQLSPLSLTAHETYWRTIDGLKERTQAERDAEVLADVDSLVQARGRFAPVLSSAAIQYDARKRQERVSALRDRILADHPMSFTAELVLLSRYRALRDTLQDSTHHDPTIQGRYRGALWAFVDRPSHVSDRLLGDAFRELVSMTDSTTNADTLLRLVRGMVKYEGINPHVAYADGAIRLADRGRDFAEAERIARAGLAVGRAKIARQKSSYETVGDYARAVDWMSAFMYDALGVIRLRQNRLDDAEKQLTHARDLDPKSVKTLYHLGQLAERRGRLADAEHFYVKGALVSTLAANPNRVALQRTFTKRTGSLDRYDAFLAGIEASDRTTRRAGIAASRAASPVALGAFQLRTTDGKLVTLDSLRGRTAVINAWGMWCGPCVAEMPELQKLATTYANDSTVRILTIDNDLNTDELRAWLHKKGYTLPTLIDDGYLARSSVHTFPTTWFVDASGRVAFTKVGWSERLTEEFGWRIEMLKTPAAAP